MKTASEWVHETLRRFAPPLRDEELADIIEDAQRDALDAAADGIEALHGEGKGATYASIGASYIRGLKP